MERLIYGEELSASQLLPEIALPDVLVFLGDLNYRINGFKKSVVQAIEKGRYDMLIKCD